MIAGLLDNTTTESLSKIPGIGNIPLLGKLFQSRSISRNNSELLVIITPEIVRPIDVGQPIPALQYMPAFPPPASPEQPSQPGLGKTGLVPVHPPSDSMPIEQLIQQQKVAPGAPPAPGSTSSSPGRLTGQENGRPGADSPAVVTYGYWERHPRSDLALVGKTLRVNGHDRSEAGVGLKSFRGASPIKLVGDLRRPPPLEERIEAELADDAIEQRGRTMFQVVGRLRPEVTGNAVPAGMDTVARQLNQTYAEEYQTPIIRHVRLSAGGRLLAIREQDLETFPRLSLMLLGLILLIALCLAILAGLAFGLMPALATRAGLTPVLKEGVDIAVRRRLSLRDIHIAFQVAGWLALLLITAYLVVGFRETAGVEIGLAPGNHNLMDPVRDRHSEQSAPFCPKRTRPRAKLSFNQQCKPDRGSSHG